MSPTDSKSLPATPAGQPVKAISVADELKAGQALVQVRSDTADAIVQNRDLLRLLVSRGYATDGEKAEIEKLYPSPARTPKSAPKPAPAPEVPADAPAAPAKA